MANDIVQARVSPELKAQADALFQELGLKTSDAIRVFLQHSVNRGGMPFELRVKQPNAETLAAMRELEEGQYDVFETPEALFASWDASMDEDNN